MQDSITQAIEDQGNFNKDKLLFIQKQALETKADLATKINDSNARTQKEIQNMASLI